MTVTQAFHRTPRDYLLAEGPDDPVLFLSPEILQATARRFLDGFPGLVTYAVKANPGEAVLGNLLAAGIGEVFQDGRDVFSMETAYSHRRQGAEAGRQVAAIAPRPAC